MKTYLATKEQLEEISEKIEPMNLETVVAGILDFENDDITITSGGYDEIRRLITT